MIEFLNVTKKFGKQPIINTLNLLIKKGEFVSVIGPSGAGKSTLVNLLIGKDRPSDGRILVNNVSIGDLNPGQIQDYRRKVGIVFQDYKLLPKKTVYENVAFGMEACQFSESKIKRTVPEVLKMVGLEKYKHQFPQELSGGETQRCAIARALAVNPQILIADEPTGNLDPENASQIIDLFVKINEIGKTVILTTHNWHLVDKLQKRVITLKGGKIVSDKEKAGYYN